MINVIEDIAKIMKYDKSHNVKVVVKPNGITVSLSEGNFDEVFDIPIKYDCLEGIYINNKKQKGVIGICDIDIVKDIMKYLEDHSNELYDLCTQCNWSGRQEEN
jgi:hypothetical protein|nr:MAG TPA: hypothetical protein [Caudoviricetes sp.]